MDTITVCMVAAIARVRYSQGSVYPGSVLYDPHDPFMTHMYDPYMTNLTHV